LRVGFGGAAGSTLTFILLTSLMHVNGGALKMVILTLSSSRSRALELTVAHKTVAELH